MGVNDFFKDFEVEIGDVKYRLRYTLQSWRLLEREGITPGNLQEKLQGNTISTISALLYYGLPAKVREELSIDQFAEKIDMDQLDKLTGSVQDATAGSFPQGSDEGSKGKGKKSAGKTV